jgi:epsilon-lactone hydrolase
MKKFTLPLVLLSTVTAFAYAAGNPVHASAFDFTGSELISDETRAALKKQEEYLRESQATREQCPSVDGAEIGEMPAIRQCHAEVFYAASRYRDLINRYNVKMTPKTINGVYTEIFTPAEGVAEKNRHRVLINLHGGAFLGGARTASHLESIPYASVGRIKVISVDYRMAPEHEFPAASEDVATVYKALLQEYKPENIGIYGCSAGGLLTAQSLAWFQREGLPKPGAVAMLCAAGYFWGDGDSGHIISAPDAQKNSYLKNADLSDPLAFPGRSDGVLAKFPPSLLITSTRDFALSSVVHTHAQLVRLGVEADLHVWEGLAHAFTFNPDFPESREAYDITVKFFDKHLGKLEAKR